jgi:hypothetical protein
VLLYLGSLWFLASSPEHTDPSTARISINNAHEQRAGAPPHPLDPVLGMARSALKLHRSRDKDYTATLIKRQRNGRRLGEAVSMELKLRSRDSESDQEVIHEGELVARAIDVYLKFLEPKSQAGREVIWRQGMNQELMTVHEAGLLNIARVEVAPTSRLAMMGNRYPITDIGIERLLIKLIEMGTRDRSLGDCDVTIFENFEFLGRRCKRIVVVHPEKNIEINGNRQEYAYHRAEIDLDLEYGVPIHYASYLWPETPGGDPLLDEEFTYQDLRLNCNLTDLDFDPDNPSYNYPSR